MSFNPYLKNMQLCDTAVPYLYATQQAVDWFDPLKDYTKLEYEWVMEHVPLEDEIVLDAGCHQGNYAVVLAACGAHVIAVDAYEPNCQITARNLSNLQTMYRVHNKAIWSRAGLVEFGGGSNGMAGHGGALVECAKLSSFAQWPTVVKVDIEGGEFEIMPAAFDEMNEVEYWIIEIHPNQGEPEVITGALMKHGFDVLKVDREIMEVVPYEPGSQWPTHATVIGVKE